jgi:hypothetical protein
MRNVAEFTVLHYVGSSDLPTTGIILDGAPRESQSFGRINKAP